MFNYQRVMISLKCRAKFKNPNPENRRLRHDNGRLPCWLAPHISANGWILAAPKKSDHWLDSSHLWQWTSLNWTNFGICWVWFPICYPLCGPSFRPTKKAHGTPGGLPSAEATRYACRVCERPSGKMLWVATSTSKKLWTSLNVVNIHHNWYKLIIDIICINLFIECSSTYPQ